MQAIRAPWTSASFLVYTGALTVLASAVWLESILSNRYSSGGFAGWAALALACALFVALAFRRAGRPLLAGLFAFVSVALFAVFVGSGIFKSADPSTRAKAIVEATTHFGDREILARVSSGLGDAMAGLSAAALAPEELLETRGW